MRDEHRRARLNQAHTTIASKHPHREILWQATRPVLLPVAGGVVVVALLVFGARAAAGAVSGPSVRVVLIAVLVFAVLAGVGLVLTRPRTGIPRSWRKYL
jgi:ABC-type transport system involved in cytochrome bd biosynthesis fused ATPase/permease subunit